MRVGIVTLGCDKNTVDNEYLAAHLEDAGCEVCLEPDPDAGAPIDAVVVTTCGFIGDAKRQSVQTLVDWADRKRNGGPKLFVAGCLAQRYANDLLHEIPDIDGLVGVGQFTQLTQMICGKEALPAKNAARKIPTVDIYEFMRRKRIDDKPYSFLKISDGCNHGCTFCSIPIMKGKLNSVAHDILLQEAQSLIRQGVRELNIVSQDLTAYGRDTSQEYRLPQLLRGLAALDGDYWIRCMYCYPGGVTDEFLDVFANSPRIVPYLDMPLQHLDPIVLRLMKRPYRDVNTVELVKRLRAAVPGIALRTTMIVGFPGETPQAHQRMLDGLRELEFDWLGAFTYSREEDTPAATMLHQTRQSTREKRRQAVLEQQAGITAERNRRRIGACERVLAERYDEERGRWIGRSPGEAPEIDGCVYFEGAAGVKPGDFVQVEIVEADVYDVFGRQVVRSAR